MISEALELYVDGGRVSQLVYVCSWSWLWWIGWGQGWTYWMICMLDNHLACREIPQHFSTCEVIH